jgi:hypothetical protein
MRKSFTLCNKIYLIILSIIGLHISSLYASDSVAVQKIILAAEQGTLSQRMANVSCFIGTYTETDKQLGILKESKDKFERNHNILQIGDPDTGLPAESHPQSIKAFQQIDLLWRMMRFSAELTLEHPVNTDFDIALISAYNGQVFDQMNDIVGILKAVYHSDNYDEESFATTLRMVTQQGMLTQKSAKEFCFISYGIDVEDNRKNLLQSIESFDNILTDLIEGNIETEILSAPTPEIEQELSSLKAQWLVIRHILLDAAEGKTSHSDEFNIISRINAPMLHKNEAIIDLYLRHYKRIKASAASSETTVSEEAADVIDEKPVIKNTKKPRLKK